MSGWIMPAPLSIPAMRYVRPSPSGIVRARSFGNVSVVMNARAAASHDAKPWPSALLLLLLASGPSGRSAARMLEIGSVWPITPVDITSVSDEGGGDDDDGGLREGEGDGARRASVARAMAHASARPWRPVTAFAQPLLTTRARARPNVCLRTSLQTVTGAAWNALRVKDAAADVGRDEVERRTARSRSDGSFFTPLCTPPRR